MSAKNVGVGKKAVSYFEQGNNWAESVFRSLSEMMEIDPALVPSIATGFGGGLGRNGFVCGAVAAGTMIIGVKGKVKGKKQVYPVVDRFLNDFESRFGNVNCRELMGVDLKTEEGMAYLKEEGHKKCSEFVRYTADKIHEIVSNEDAFDQS